MAKNYIDQNGLTHLLTLLLGEFNSKVDKVDGKQLSTNDFTNELLQKLNGIAAGAEVNVQSDWNQTTNTADDFIKNKPTALSQFTNDAGFITSDDIPEGAAKTTTPPKMDGDTAIVGEEMAFAAGDHVHPHDTTRVPVTRTVNGKALSEDIALVASDVGAVPTTRKINNKTLDADVTLAVGDISGAVPNTRTVNGKALSSDVTITLDELGGVPNTRTINTQPLSADIVLDADDVGAVPTTRTVNGKALSSNITLAAGDVGAIPSSEKGIANGVATLDGSGLVPSSQLPSYVDDVVEGYLFEGKFYEDEDHTTEITGETGKIYVDLTTGGSYRWSGSTYVEIASSDMVALSNGEIDTIFNSVFNPGN